LLGGELSQRVAPRAARPPADGRALAARAVRPELGAGGVAAESASSGSSSSSSSSYSSSSSSKSEGDGKGDGKGEGAEAPAAKRARIAEEIEQAP
jgi:hypothetical protein